MKIYKCIGKLKEKNVIKEYALMDEMGKVDYIASKQLKVLILNKSVEVRNLKLTVDNRLIEVKPIETLSKKKSPLELITEGYIPKSKEEEVKLNYLHKKVNSKRVGTALKKCLLIGLATVSLSSSMLGCGSTSENTSGLETYVTEVSKDTLTIKGNDSVTVTGKGGISGLEFENTKGQANKSTYMVFDKESGKTLILDKSTNMIKIKDGETIGYIKEDEIVRNTVYFYDMKDKEIARVEPNGTLSAKITVKDENNEYKNVILQIASQYAYDYEQVGEKDNENMLTNRDTNHRDTTHVNMHHRHHRHHRL